MKRDAAEAAARNIARGLGRPPSLSALVVCSAVKRGFADRVASALGEVGISASVSELAGVEDSARCERLLRLRHLLPEIAPTWGLVFLIAPSDAAFLFDVVGRPDRGIRIASDHLYADFLMSLPGLIRTMSADPCELEEFKALLLSALGQASELEVTTPVGTCVRLVPRRWLDCSGEVFTAPVEGLASGVIAVDGCAYWGPPRNPFVLRLEGGKVVNLDELDLADEQQKMVFIDLTRDANARVLAEFGLGVNPNALEDADLMEAEQARGTCHFGFGHSLEYEGSNVSSYHFDLVVRRPTIRVGDRVAMKDGVVGTSWGQWSRNGGQP